MNRIGQIVLLIIAGAAELDDQAIGTIQDAGCSGSACQLAGILGQCRGQAGRRFFACKRLQRKIKCGRMPQETLGVLVGGIGSA